RGAWGAGAGGGGRAGRRGGRRGGGCRAVRGRAGHWVPPERLRDAARLRLRRPRVRRDRLRPRRRGPAGPHGQGQAQGPAVTPSRVAYVIGTTAGGTGRHVAMLARGCAGRGAAVRVFGPAATRSLFPADQFMLLDIAERPRPARDLAAVLRLRRLLARYAPEIVHAHGLRAGAVTALALPRVPRARRPAIVVTVHSAAPSGILPGAVYLALERVTARRAGAVLCASADLAGRMRRAGAHDVALAVVPAPWAAAPSAQAVDRARAGLGAPGRPIVLAVGRLAPQKGFDVLIEAMITLRYRDPPPLLAIPGDRPLAPPPP